MNWDSIRESVLTPSRIVPLTAQLLTAGVGILTTWLGTKGWLNLDPGQVVGFVTPLVLGAEASIFKWQQGWQKYEERSATDTAVIEEYDVHPDDLIPDENDLDSEGAKTEEENETKVEEQPKAPRERRRRG
jgi:hypothetical protein